MSVHERPKIAIVAPGGGTGCAYGAGGFTALAAEYNLKPDIIIAASGDAGTGAFYTSGQIKECETIWTEALATSKFVARWRILRIMKLDYLIDTVLKKLHPFDVDAFYASDIAYYVPITDRKGGSTRYVSNKDGRSDSVDMFEVLRATKAIPVLVPPVTIEGAQYQDGSFGASFDDLLNKAVELGAGIIIGLDSRWRKKPISVTSTNERDVCIITTEKNPSSPLTSSPKKLRESFDMGYRDVATNLELKKLLT